MSPKLRRQLKYWPSRGVAVARYPSSFPFGNNPGSCFQFLLKRESLTDIVRKQGPNSMTSTMLAEFNQRLREYFCESPNIKEY